eukprot:COSAG06_NODE_7351_length_2534_cov_17.988501_1_plen_65_part_10
MQSHYSQIFSARGPSVKASWKVVPAALVPTTEVTGVTKTGGGGGSSPRGGGGGGGGGRGGGGGGG